MDDSTVWDLRARLAYVPQEPDLGTGTVRQWIERPFSYQANTDRKKNLAGLDDLFKCFQLDRSLLESDISTISGGEKQRVALVSAITLDRTIYLLDEPASALDERNTEILMDYFRARDDLCVVAAAHAAGGELLHAGLRRGQLVLVVDQDLHAGVPPHLVAEHFLRGVDVHALLRPRRRRAPVGRPGQPDDVRGDRAPAAGRSRDNVCHPRDRKGRQERRGADKGAQIFPGLRL